MSNKRPCPHCGPLPVNHLENWLNSLLDSFVFVIERKLFFLRQGRSGLVAEKLGNFFSASSIALLRLFKIISFKTIIDRTKVYNRTLVLLDEAKERGIETGSVLVFGRHNNHFFARINNKPIIFQGLPFGKKSVKPESLSIDDKALAKKILKQHGLPVVDGKSFFSSSKGFKYGLALGFPLVVKPRWGSVSRHVFLNINSINDLRHAIREAKKICLYFLVEKYLVDAQVYRATTVNFKLGGAVKRTPANVIGDGACTIRELAAAKNRHPWRGSPGQKDATYLKIILDQTTDELLKEQNLSLDLVPSDGQQVFLQRKIILDLGADLIDVTGQTHFDNISLFENISQIFDAKILGIDFLCQDIGVSWKEQKCAIMELNSLPFIDMHHLPLSGQPRNLAAQIWEMILNE